MKQYFFILAVLIFSCTPSNNEKTLNRPSEWIGLWKAEWETPPESYPELVDMEFYMDGHFVFTQDSLRVIANGYPDCIFGVDTLSHTQSWYVSGDTLFLMNDPQSPGITYRVAYKEENRIRLQFLEDIFVTLTK